MCYLHTLDHAPDRATARRYDDGCKLRQYAFNANPFREGMIDGGGNDHVLVKQVQHR